MKKVWNATVCRNEKIIDGIYDMTFDGTEIISQCKAGQFVEVYVGNGEMILPRPISICETDQQMGTIRIVYQTVGKGTEYFSKLNKGDCVKVLGPLGNGFEIVKAGNYVVVGGGVGVPPMLELCKALKEENANSVINVFLGFRDTVFLVEEFEKLGAVVRVATDSGSVGFKGNVIQLMDETGFKGDMVYSCGPKVMLKSLANWAEKRNIPCQISMEERMACGIGACVGCVVKVKNDESPDGWMYKKVCKDGPVFSSKEVIWDE